jgi:amino acid transporter
LASAGDLPSWLARTNARGAPTVALIVVTGVGSVAAAFPPDSVMVVFIFLLGIAYELLLIAFLRFDRTHPHLERPYRAIGGSALGWFGTALGLAVLIACYQLQVAALTWAIAIAGGSLVYFVVRRRVT